jgi:hypothetical protein
MELIDAHTRTHTHTHTHFKTITCSMAIVKSFVCNVFFVMCLLMGIRNKSEQNLCVCVSSDKGTVQKVIALPTNRSLDQDLILEELEVFKV